MHSQHACPARGAVTTGLLLPQHVSASTASITALLRCLQIIRGSLLEDDSSTSRSAAAGVAPKIHQPSTAAAAAEQEQPPQQEDALSSYTGGPVFLVTDIKSTGDAPTNIATIPSAPFLYGVSIGICMSSAMSEPGGAGLGTVGWHEVRRQQGLPALLAAQPYISLLMVLCLSIFCAMVLESVLAVTT